MKLLLLFLILILFVEGSGAETIVYDNLTGLNCKVIKFEDPTNIKYVNQYSYDIFLNGYFVSSYEKSSQVCVQDNSSILIFLNSPLKNELVGSYDVGKAIFSIGFFWLVSVGLIIIFIIYLFRVVWRRR